LERVTSAFERIELPWLDNTLGVTDEVYAPFEPVKVQDKTVSCVQRKHVVGDDGLLESIQVKGEEILAGPIRFDLSEHGEQVPVLAEGAVRFGESVDSATRWRARASGGSVTLISDVAFEFDGLARYELKVAPKGKSAKLDRLSLVVPLQEQYGYLIHALPLGGDFRDYEVSWRLPDRQGVIWDSKHDFHVEDIFQPTLGNFVPMVWLGGTVRGLCYVAESDEGWAPSDEKPALTVTRQGRQIDLTLNFISEPYEVKSPRKIVFGLVATPTKPLPANHRVWAKGDIESHGKIAGRLFSCDSFAPWMIDGQRHNVRKGAFDFHPQNYDWQRAERKRRQVPERSSPDDVHRQSLER
jgi:hypothetical protein